MKAVEYCSNSLNSSQYEAIYTHDRGTIEVIINDNFITSEEVARLRAKAELVKGAYSIRTVSITTIYNPNLKQNDIISFKGVLWIVREIILSYDTPTLTMQIKGLRYD